MIIKRLYECFTLLKTFFQEGKCSVWIFFFGLLSALVWTFIQLIINLHMTVSVTTEEMYVRTAAWERLVLSVSQADFFFLNGFGLASEA